MPVLTSFLTTLLSLPRLESLLAAKNHHQHTHRIYTSTLPSPNSSSNSIPSCKRPGKNCAHLPPAEHQHYLNKKRKCKRLGGSCAELAPHRHRHPHLGNKPRRTTGYEKGGEEGQERARRRGRRRRGTREPEPAGDAVGRGSSAGSGESGEEREVRNDSVGLFERIPQVNEPNDVHPLRSHLLFGSPEDADDGVDKGCSEEEGEDVPHVSRDKGKQREELSPPSAGPSRSRDRGERHRSARSQEAEKRRGDVYDDGSESPFRDPRPRVPKGKEYGTDAPMMSGGLRSPGSEASSRRGAGLRFPVSDEVSPDSHGSGSGRLSKAGRRGDDHGRLTESPNGRQGEDGRSLSGGSSGRGSHRGRVNGEESTSCETSQESGRSSRSASSSGSGDRSASQSESLSEGEMAASAAESSRLRSQRRVVRPSVDTTRGMLGINEEANAGRDGDVRAKLPNQGRRSKRR